MNKDPEQRVNAAQQKLLGLSHAASALADNPELINRLQAAVLSDDPRSMLGEIPIPDELINSGHCWELFRQAFVVLAVPARVCRLVRGGQEVLTFEYLPPLDPQVIYDEPPAPWPPFETYWDEFIQALVGAGLAKWTEETWDARKEIVTAPTLICGPDIGRPPIDPWTWAFR